MTKQNEKTERKPTKYTHSAWSGKKYDHPMTVEDLTKESLNVLRNHPTIGKCLRG